MKTKIYLFLLCVLTLTAVQVRAANPVATVDPTVMSAEVITPKMFPEFLAERGYKNQAIQEWLKMAYHSRDPRNVAKAWWHVGMLHLEQKEYEKALLALQDFGQEAADKDKIDEAMYWMAYASLKQNRSADAQVYLERLQSQKSPWGAKLKDLIAWEKAKKGDTPTGSEQLDARLAKVRDFSPYVAAVLNFIPGAGYLYLTDWRTALMSFFLVMLMVWGVYFTLKQKAWGATVVFGFVLSSIYMGQIFGAYSLAKRENLELKQAAMSVWHDLKPLEK